ncbi:MAG: methionyl-tRNA formyltransferase [Sulfurovum sp.]|nr:methionyl-tRNA formyltransferase [Sulfurovum sp.]
MKKKIIYMGTPLYAAEILKTLIETNDMIVELVVTQPDRPVGRKKIVTPPPTKVVAKKNSISVLQPNRLSDRGVEEAMKKVNPDFIVVAAFGQLLPKNILNIAPCINLHASLLPQYRGASPVHQSLLHGDKETGVTSMLMEEGLDTGDILKRKIFIIPPDMRLYALMDQLTQDACDVTLSTLRNFDSIMPQPQNSKEATLCKKIRKSDGEISCSDAIEVYNKYRAFEGWPGIFTSNGTKLDNIVLIEKNQIYTPFEILSFKNNDIVIGCGTGSLKVGTLQPVGKKPMSAKAYCVGRGLKVGDTLFS